MCNGVLSEPYLPDLNSSRDFAGDIVHSCNLQDENSLTGKSELVIDVSKSAIDYASLSGQKAESCSLLSRQLYWMMPRYFGRIRIDKLVYSRWSEKMSFPAYHYLYRVKLTGS